jgi:fumarate hydratase subunit beta
MSVTTAADGLKDVTTPLSDADVESLRTGTECGSPRRHTARDAAHGRLWPLIQEGKQLPIDVRGQIIYYTGPSPAKPGVSPVDRSHCLSRMDKFTPALIVSSRPPWAAPARSQSGCVQAVAKGVYFGASGRWRRALAEREARRDRRVRDPAWRRSGALRPRGSGDRERPYGGDLYQDGMGLCAGGHMSSRAIGQSRPSITASHPRTDP